MQEKEKQDHATSYRRRGEWMFMKQHFPLVSFAFINSHLYAHSKFTLGTSTRSSLHPKQRGGAGAFDSSEKEIHALRRVSHTLLRTWSISAGKNGYCRVKTGRVGRSGGTGASWTNTIMKAFRDGEVFYVNGWKRWLGAIRHFYHRLRFSTGKVKGVTHLQTVV